MYQNSGEFVDPEICRHPEECTELGECLCFSEMTHDECGLNIELCICPDSPISYNHDENMYIVKDRKIDDEGNETGRERMK